MSKPKPKALEPEIRAQVMRELSSSMERLALDLPHADAAIILKLAIGFFAGAYAEQFGDVEAARVLNKTARFALSLAQGGFLPASENREPVSLQ